MSFNEQVFLPSRVTFITGKDPLYEFEKQHAELEPLVKTLLRTYEGIFDQPVSIYEKMIAGILRQDVETTVSQLKKLHAFSIIQFDQQKDSPQIFFIQNRIRTGDLVFNEKKYRQRKEQLTRRIHDFIKYIIGKKTCRSTMIGGYFGDKEMKACKICDNCLDYHNNELTAEEFEKIHQQIMAVIRPRPFQSRDLLKHLPGIKKEKAWKVVHFLQAENKIEVDKDGMIRVK